MINNISKNFKDSSTVLATVLALSIMQAVISFQASNTLYAVITILIQTALAITLAWQTLKNGWLHGVKLIFWCALPVLALVIDREISINYLAFFASYVLTVILSICRERKVPWEVMIYVGFLIAAGLAVVINYTLHPEVFWHKQLSDAMSALPSVTNQLQQTLVEESKYISQHATIFIISAILILAVSFVAITEDSINKVLRTKGKKLKTKGKTDFAILGISLVFISLIISAVNKDIGLSLLIPMLYAFICTGFARAYALCNKNKDQKISLMILYLAAMFMPATLAVFGLGSAVYSIVKIFLNKKINLTQIKKQGEFK